MEEKKNATSETPVQQEAISSPNDQAAYETPNQQNIISKKLVLIVLLLVILILLIIVVTQQSLNNTHPNQSQIRQDQHKLLTPQPSPFEILFREKIVQSSTEYTFEWDQQNKQANVKKNGTDINNFNLDARPLAVWIDKNSMDIFVIASRSGEIDSVQDLYIIKESKAIKVVELNDFELNDGTKSPSRFYYPIISKDYPQYYPPLSDFPDEHLAKLKKAMEWKIRKFPQSNFVTLDWTGYEADGEYIINAETLEIEETSFDGAKYWSKDSPCAISFASYYGDYQKISLGKIENNQLIIHKPEDGGFSQTSNYDVYWEGLCSGYIKVTAAETEKGDHYYEDVTKIYKFDANSFSFQLVSSLPNTAIPATHLQTNKSENDIINIMFTTKIEDK